MKNIVLVAIKNIFCFFVFYAMTTVGAEMKYTPDGRFGTKCFPEHGGEGRELCRVTLSQLKISSEKFHNKRIESRGKIIVIENVYGFSDGWVNLWFNLDDGDKKDIDCLVGYNVRFWGAYDAKDFGRFDLWDGRIYLDRLVGDKVCDDSGEASY